MARRLNDWLSGYMKFVENSEPPDSYKLWTGISTLAACMKRKCWLMWDKPTYPNMYIVLTGPAGRCRKGTAMRPAEDMLRSLGITISADSITREALIRSLDKCLTTTFDEESNMAIQHSSLTIFSPELTIFLGSHPQMLEHLCDWYDCRTSFKYETKTSTSNYITNVWVNLIGATTPELIQSLLPVDAIGGGFTRRVIFVLEFQKGKTVTIPFRLTKEYQLEQDLLADLEQVHMMQGQFKIDKSFLTEWSKWYPTCEEDFELLTPDPRMAGYSSCRGTHMLKLSMILSASRTDDMVILGDDFIRAKEILEKTEINMPKIFTGVGKNPTADVIARVAGTIEARKEIRLSTLLSMYYNDADTEMLRRVLATLQDMKFCTMTLEKDPIIRYAK